MYFPTRFLDLIFLIIFQFVFKLLDTWSPSKSNGVQNGIKNKPSGAKTSKVEIATCPKTCSWNILAPEPPLEAPWVRFFIICEDLGSFQAPFWMIFNVSWHGFLYKIQVFAQSARHQKQCNTTCKKLLHKRTCKTPCRERNLQEMQRAFRELARDLPNESHNHKRRIAFFDATATATNARTVLSSIAP